MKFRKKPVVIEAVQWTGANVDEVLGFIVTKGSARRGLGDERNALFIDTLEGTMRADASDWIIKGVKGEFYPCKPDIFVATYEAEPMTPPHTSPMTKPMTEAPHATPEEMRAMADESEQWCQFGTVGRPCHQDTCLSCRRAVALGQGADALKRWAQLKAWLVSGPSVDTVISRRELLDTFFPNWFNERTP